MLKILKYIVAVSFCGILNAIILLSLMRVVMYEFNGVNIFLLTDIGLAMVWIMGFMRIYGVEGNVVRLIGTAISYGISVFYAVFVSYENSLNVLGNQMIMVSSLIHGLMIVLSVIMIVEARKK